MNIKNLIQIASNFLPSQKKNQLQQALNRAEQMLGNRQVNTRNEALKVLTELGIQGDFLTKLRGMVNNPLASTICRMGGIDKNALLKDLESLRGNSPTRQVNQPINDDLSRFRAELEGISKK